MKNYLFLLTCMSAFSCSTKSDKPLEQVPASSPAPAPAPAPVAPVTAVPTEPTTPVKQGDDGYGEDEKCETERFSTVVDSYGYIVALRKHGSDDDDSGKGRGDGDDDNNGEGQGEEIDCD